MIFSIRKFPKSSMVIFGQGLHGFPIDLENIPAKFQISEKNFVEDSSQIHSIAPDHFTEN